MKSKHDEGMEVLAERFARQDEAYRRLGQAVVRILQERGPVFLQAVMRSDAERLSCLGKIQGEALALDLLDVGVRP